jgi:hypothetical protein
VQRQSIWVLWRTAMPSILTEVGFLTNPEEEKFLGSEKGQKYLANSIFRAFRNYKNDVEGKLTKYEDEFENEEPLINENLSKGDTLKNNKENESPKEGKEETKLEEKYGVLLNEASGKLKEKKYDEAKALYKKASEMKPDEQLPKDKISEIEKTIDAVKSKREEEEKNKVQKEESEKYKKLIASADKSYNEKKWEDAKVMYRAAGNFRPDEKYPQEKIEEITSIQEKIAAIETAQKEQNKNISSSDILNSYKNKNPDKDSVKENNPLTNKEKSAKDIIEFKVQFASSDKEIDENSEKYKNLERLWHYKVGNMYKYTSGNFTSPDAAVRHQGKVRALGYKDAFVAAFRNEQRIDYNEAVKQLNK